MKIIEVLLYMVANSKKQLGERELQNLLYPLAMRGMIEAEYREHCYYGHYSPEVSKAIYIALISNFLVEDILPIDDLIKHVYHITDEGKNL